MGLKKRYLAPSLDQVKPTVLKGVWKRYDESPHQSLKWTLENFSALIVVACLTSFIALAQTQCWCLLRYIIAQYTKSPRLPDDSTPDPLLKLSQGDAIVSVMPVLSRWTSRLYNKIRGLFQAESRHTRRDTEVPDDPVESPYFGIASILNISLFLVMGVAIPWWLTEGALGTPIVKSSNTEECLKSNSASHWVESVNRLLRADNIFHLCQDRLNAGCDSPYHLSNPQITKSRSIACPFAGSICQVNNPFEITQWNISAFEMGVNSRTKLSMTRRLTCAPVWLDPFLSRPQNSSSFIYVKKAYYNESVKLWPNISLILSTKNGPNFFLKEDSGLRMVQENGPHDLTVLPSGLVSSDVETTELNELMERDDGQSFLVVYRAGRRLFFNKIHDPFFSAQRKTYFSFGARPGIYYYPDHEATALGCVEQFQYCLTQSSLPNHCTHWSTCNKAFLAMYDYLASQFPGGFNGNITPEFEHWNGQFAWSLKEMLVLHKSLCSAFEVRRYIVDRKLFFNRVPLIDWGASVSDYISFEDDREPWVAEVETWFMKSFLSGILTVQDGSLFAIEDLDPAFSPGYIQEWKLCGRILFHSKDFTNINWTGFWVTVTSLTFICLVGNQVHRVHRGSKGSLKFMARWMKKGILCFQKLPRTIQSLRPAMWFSKPVTIWNVFMFPQSPSRRWHWYGSGSGLNENSDNTEMDDLEDLT